MWRDATEHIPVAVDDIFMRLSRSSSCFLSLSLFLSGVFFVCFVSVVNAVIAFSVDENKSGQYHCHYFPYKNLNSFWLIITRFFVLFRGEHYKAFNHFRFSFRGY